ncbi:MAG TPA: hypothetical protein VF544_13895 [Pyrinomonadaceae bacterium]|jgi:hypothetical protein
MRRRLLLIYPALLCALCLSGWGGVLAAAFCPHASASARAAASVEAGQEMDDDHACCHADARDAQEEHCSNSSHEAMVETKARPATERHSQALAPSEDSCSHCIGRSSLPVRPAKASEPSQHRHDARGPAKDEAKPVAPPIFRIVSSIAPTQGAPPGPTARKHLLLSIFLI